MRVYLRFAHFTGSEALELAVAAEEAGFDGVLLSDHLCFPTEPASRFPYSPSGEHPFGARAPWPDLFVTVGALAAVTTTLRFLTAVYLLPLRHPLLVAKSLATAAIYAQGRFSLGVGVGWMRDEYDALGVQFARRGRRLEESVAVVRKALEGVPFSHDGEFFRFPEMEMHPVPSSVPDVLLGGPSEVAMRRAAKLGDGYVGVTVPPSELGGVVGRMRQLVADHGRDPEKFDICMGCTEESTAEHFSFVADAGVDAMYVMPWEEPTTFLTSTAHKRRHLERLANELSTFRAG